LLDELACDPVCLSRVGPCRDLLPTVRLHWRGWSGHLALNLRGAVGSVLLADLRQSRNQPEYAIPRRKLWDVLRVPQVCLDPQMFLRCQLYHRTSAVLRLVKARASEVTIPALPRPCKRRGFKQGPPRRPTLPTPTPEAPPRHLLRTILLGTTASTPKGKADGRRKSPWLAGTDCARLSCYRLQ